MDRQEAHNRPVVVVVMGVSSSGKTTVAKLLAETLGWHNQEGDALHPPANVAKMSSGTPLTDSDRWPWLQAIANRIDAWRRRGEPGVVICSALKRAYRDILICDRPDVALVYLKGAHDLVAARMAGRKGRFMPPSHLDNQFATLEEPSADERPIVVDVGETRFRIVEEIMRRLAAVTDSLTSVAPER